MQEAKVQYVLKRLHEELDQFIETVHEIPYLALPSERLDIICFSQKIGELSGYDADEILADREHWANLIHPNDRQKVFAAYAECKNWGVSFKLEYRIVNKDGSLCRVIDKGEPVFNDKGEIIHIEGAIVPISQSGMTQNTAVSDTLNMPVFGDDILYALRKFKMG
jgi:PAS domain S-box-containing protein